MSDEVIIQEIATQMIDITSFFVESYLKNLEGIGTTLMQANEEMGKGDIRQDTARDLYMYLALINEMATDMSRDINKAHANIKEMI